jgi:hypothetical protein
MKHVSGLHARPEGTSPAMPTLAQIYEEHAEDCIRSAARTDDPKRRDLLLKLAIQWREEAQGMRQSKPQPNKARVQGEDPDRAALKAQRIRQTSASFT